MKIPFHVIASFCVILLASCAPPRTPYDVDGPTTIGLPGKLSERERAFFPEIESALRNEGLVPVSSGKGDLQLDFKVEQGPINTDTRIAISESGSDLLVGQGRATGAPMIGRANRADRSFTKAFSQFNADLGRVAARRGWSTGSTGSTGSTASTVSDDPEGTLPDFSTELLPVY